MSVVGRSARMAAAMAALTLLCLYPAIINGFPLLFSDSGAYIWDYRFPGAPPFYTLFIWITSLRAFLCMTVLVQAVTVALTLTIFLRATGGVTRPGVLFAAAFGVLALNQAPWLTSWIMPDIFTGLGIAALCALLLTPERLDLIGGAFLAGIAGFATLTTTANGPLFVGLIVTCLILRAVLAGRAPHTAGTLAAMGMVALALVTTMAANQRLHGAIALNSGGPVLAFSRLADTGIAQLHVEERCRTETFRICAYIDALNDYTPGGQTFLWDGVADATDARGKGRDEYAQLVSEILAARWPDIVRAGLRDAAVLFGRPILTFDHKTSAGELGPMTGFATNAWIASK